MPQKRKTQNQPQQYQQEQNQQQQNDQLQTLSNLDCVSDDLAETLERISNDNNFNNSSNNNINQNDINTSNTNSNIQITGSYNNANIEYATSYPEIEKANILFNLDSNILRLLAKDGTVAGQNISSLEVISDLSESDLMINTHWITSGGTNNLIQAINNSPLYEYTQEFTNQLITNGNAILDLKINFPITNPDEINFEAKYELNDIVIQKIPKAPNGKKIKNVEVFINLKN